MGTASQVAAVERLVLASVASVDAIAPDALRAVIPALRQARDELQRELRTWIDTVPNGANRFTAHERAKALRAIEGALDRVKDLEPAIGQALAIGRHATGPLSIANLNTEITRLGSIFGDVISMPQIDTAAVIAKGDRLLWKRHERSAARYAGAVGDDIKNLFAVGLAKGETFEQLVTRLRRIGGGRGVGIGAGDPGTDIANGLFQRHKHWADRLVRTEVMHGYNVQHATAIAAVNDMRPEGEEEYLRRWDSSPDGARCPLCAELHGKVTKIGKEFPGGPMNPPRHPHCRCVVLAWLKRWGDMKGETQPTGEVPSTPAKQPPPPKEPAPLEVPRAERSSALRDRLGWSVDKERTFDTPHGNFTEKMLKRGSARRVAVPQSNIKPAAPAPTSDAIEFVPKKNPKRVAAAEKAGAASAAKKREIFSTAQSNLPKELQVAWEQEGHKFMREESKRIKGIKDPVHAGSKLSEAFAEKYGGGEASVFGNEGDRFAKRAELEAKHANKWADDQEAKYYAQAAREMERSGEIDAGGSLTRRGKARAAAPLVPYKPPVLPDDPPF